MTVLVGVVTVLLVAGMFQAVALSQLPGAIHGDFMVEPGRRVGVLTLGATMKEIENRIGPYSWEMPRSWHWQVFARLYFWREQGAMLAVCGDKVAAVMIFYVASTVMSPDDLRRLNDRTGRLRTPEGRGLGSQIDDFDRIFGQPVGVVDGVVLSLAGENRPLRLYASGLLLVTAPGETKPWGIGVYNLDICRGGGRVDERPYVPYLGRGAEFKAVFFSKTGDEQRSKDQVRGRGWIGPPVVADSVPAFGMKEWVNAGTEVCFSPQNFQRRVPYTRAFVFPDGRENRFSPERLIEPGETCTILIATMGLVFPRISCGFGGLPTCEVRFWLGQMLVASAQFRISE